jgi:hypothetical protein
MFLSILRVSVVQDRWHISAKVYGGYRQPFRRLPLASGLLPI